jgi:hypothetical protein
MKSAISPGQRTAGTGREGLTLSLVLLITYFLSHFALSRVSVRMVERDWGIEGFFIYLPFKPDFVADHERHLLDVHAGLSNFFYPAWMIDNHVLGGPKPI